MQEIHFILKNYMLLGAEFLAALIGVIYFFRLKNSYWKWFTIYLIIIFIQEFFWINNYSSNILYRDSYYVFFGLPLQFIFLYWLYALKSIKNKKLFLLTVIIYFVTIGISFAFKNLYEVSSISRNVGSLILMVLLILEFIKQVKTDDILKFKENKMFYINIGLILFYIANYPFNIFGKELYENHRLIHDLYYIYFLISNCTMYLLFAASYIWGKTQS